MTYPREWMASTDPKEEKGDATFMVEGFKYTMRLQSFEDFCAVSKMLDAAFDQGKSFAAQAIRSHVERSLQDAVRDHAL